MPIRAVLEMMSKGGVFEFKITNDCFCEYYAPFAFDGF